METQSTWFKNAEFTYNAIIQEFNTLHPEHLSQIIPKLIVMYEFFRFLRGEAFLDRRGIVSIDEQKRLYEMQDEIGDKLQSLKAKLDPNDPAVLFHLSEMKKQFDI